MAGWWVGGMVMIIFLEMNLHACVFFSHRAHSVHTEVTILFDVMEKHKKDILCSTNLP